MHSLLPNQLSTIRRSIHPCKHAVRLSSLLRRKYNVRFLPLNKRHFGPVSMRR